MKAPRIVIAAPNSGSGKTLITCALLKALKKRGKAVAAFKCGPDYIDPMFHQQVIGVPSKNLDSFFSEAEQIEELFLMGREERELSVIEGVMGIYDGLGGVSQVASTYHLAQILKAPIILVVDTRGMSRSLLPLIAGFLQYDSNCLIQGVILNRTTGEMHNLLKPMLEEELQIPVLGYFPKQDNLQIDSRYLGLKLPGEVENIADRVEEAAKVLETCVDVERILALADMAPEFFRNNQETLEGDPEGGISDRHHETLRLGIARDEAFCFYYEDNLRLFETMGVELVPFSPIHDKRLPEHIHGLLLGGGYPELWAGELAENTAMRQEIREAIRGGMPSLAECGGFMYLHEALVTRDGISYPMCGVIPAGCSYRGHLVRFGYVEIEEKNACFLPQGTKIKAHEFHYFDSTDNGEDCWESKPSNHKKWLGVHTMKNHFWGFPHLYYPSNPKFVEHFVEEIMKYKICHFDKNMS